MRVLVSGSTGLIGSALVQDLKRQGYQVVRLVRRKEQWEEPSISWDVLRGQLDPKALEGIGAVIHLAGENIAAGRWSPERKKRIFDSRVQGTRLLAETLAKMENPPQTLISASAVGFYGDRGGEVLTEVSAPGQGFLSETCRAWEGATAPAAAKGIRVVHARFGMILSPEGGALKAMLLPFRLGIAGTLGLKGRQYMSWIALDDAVAGLAHLLSHSEIRGPVNMVSPQPVTNAEFTRVMRRKLFPAFLPMHYWTPPAPALAIRTILGEMGRELLLASERAMPVRLLETGFHFRYPAINSALDALL